MSIVVSVPEKFKHLAPKDYRVGTKSNRLVGFVDLAPSMLSLAGVKAPSFYQGRAFLGPDEAAARTHSFGFRGRMDERQDCVRSVRNQRYVYVRNYMPHKIYGQHLAYMWETPTTQVWERLHKEGKLNAAQSKFWQTKPAEELYDLTTDRDEVNNLAESPAHRGALDELRKAHRAHMVEVRDVGLLPEAEMHARAGGGAPYAAGHDAKKYPLDRVLAAAELASSLRPGVTAQLVSAMGDTDSAVRYWGAMGVLMRGESEFQAARATVVKLAADPAPAARIVAAELLGRYGTAEELAKALETLMGLADPVANGIPLAIQALNSIDALGKKAAPLKSRIDALPRPKESEPQRIKEYTIRLRQEILATIG